MILDKICFFGLIISRHMSQREDMDDQHMNVNISRVNKYFVFVVNEKTN